MSNINTISTELQNLGYKLKALGYSIENIEIPVKNGEQPVLKGYLTEYNYTIALIFEYNNKIKQIEVPYESTSIKKFTLCEYKYYKMLHISTNKTKNKTRGINIFLTPDFSVINAGLYYENTKYIMSTNKEGTEFTVIEKKNNQKKHVISISSTIDFNNLIEIKGYNYINLLRVQDNKIKIELENLGLSGFLELNNKEYLIIDLEEDRAYMITGKALKGLELARKFMFKSKNIS